MSYIKKFETRRNTDSNDVINEWYQKCTINSIPFIYVILRKKYVNIKWDSSNFDDKCDSLFERLGDNLINDLIALFKKYAVKKSKYEVGCDSALYIDMPINTFNLMANDLFDLIVLKMSNTEVF